VHLFFYSLVHQLVPLPPPPPPTVCHSLKTTVSRLRPCLCGHLPTTTPPATTRSTLITTPPPTLKAPSTYHQYHPNYNTTSYTFSCNDIAFALPCRTAINEPVVRSEAEPPLPVSAANNKLEERPTPNAQQPSPTQHEPTAALPPLSLGPSETDPAVQPKALAPQPVSAVNAAQQHAEPTPTPTFVEEPAAQPPQPTSATSHEQRIVTPRGVPPLLEVPPTSFPAAGVAAPTAVAVVEVSPPGLTTSTSTSPAASPATSLRSHQFSPEPSYLNP